MGGDATDVLFVPLKTNIELNHTLAPVYNVLATASVRLGSTTEIEANPAVHHKRSHVLVYSFISVGTVALVVLIAFVVFCVLRRNKLNRNRHHLMPMYNFDIAEEDARWEADLLEDDREQQIALNQNITLASRPKLKFHSHALDI